MEYKLITVYHDAENTDAIDEFQNLIENALNTGYVFAGPFVANALPNNAVCYYQPMIKLDDPNLEGCQRMKENSP